MFSALIELAIQNLLYFALHLENNGAFPKPLSRDEEKDCLLKIALGDHAARNKLIEHNMRLVAYIVKKKYSDSKEQEDLISIGMIGLIKASETFDIKKDISFSTYAGTCIDNTIYAQRLSKVKASIGEYLSGLTTIRRLCTATRKPRLCTLRCTLRNSSFGVPVN